MSFHAYLLHDFLMRVPYEISCFFAVVRFSFDFMLSCRCEMSYAICRVLPHTFLMRFPYEMSCFLAVMRCPV
jgi:hypothetical protein